MVISIDRRPVEVRLGSAGARTRLAAAVFVPVVIVPPAVPDRVRRRLAVFALTGRATVVATPVRTVN